MQHKTILTYGTFDLFHVGHLRLLERIRSFGEKLVVGCSTDQFNSEKGKRTIIPFKQRCEIIKAVRYVDIVIPERSWDQKLEDIKQYGIDTFVMGDDWRGKFDFLKEHCEVVYLERTEGISSSEIKQALMDIYSLNEKSMSDQFEILMQLIDDLG